MPIIIAQPNESPQVRPLPWKGLTYLVLFAFGYSIIASEAKQSHYVRDGDCFGHLRALAMACCSYYLIGINQNQTVPVKAPIDRVLTLVYY